MKDFLKRPSQHLVFIRLTGEKSLSNTWCEGTDDNDRCVLLLLVWRISRSSASTTDCLTDTNRRIYGFSKSELKGEKKRCFKWLVMHWNRVEVDMNVLNGVCFLLGMIILVFKYLKKSINCLRKSNRVCEKETWLWLNDLKGTYREYIRHRMLFYLEPGPKHSWYTCFAKRRDK